MYSVCTVLYASNYKQSAEVGQAVDALLESLEERAKTELDEVREQLEAARQVKQLMKSLPKSDQKSDTKSASDSSEGHLSGQMKLIGI